MQAESDFLSRYKSSPLRMNTLARRIDAGCDALRISQNDLADRVGMTQRQVLYQIKKGERPGRKWMPVIAKELNCTVEWLVNGTGTPPTWATMQADSAAKSRGTAQMTLVMATDPKAPQSAQDDEPSADQAVFAKILKRLDNIEQLLSERLPNPTHDETIRAGLAVSDPPNRNQKSGLVPQSTP